MLNTPGHKARVVTENFDLEKTWKIYLGCCFFILICHLSVNILYTKVSCKKPNCCLSGESCPHLSILFLFVAAPVCKTAKTPSAFWGRIQNKNWLWNKIRKDFGWWWQKHTHFDYSCWQNCQDALPQNVAFEADPRAFQISTDKNGASCQDVLSSLSSWTVPLKRSGQLSFF